MAIPPEVRRFISENDSFLILGHREPDGDCVASQLSCAALLSKLGKSCGLYSVGPFDRPEIESFGPLFASDIPPHALAGVNGKPPAAIILDCSTPDRTGALGARVRGLPGLVIDHHRSGEEFGDVRFIAPDAPSTTMLVMDLYTGFGIIPTVEQARWMLFGLCTDTNFFRHLGQGGASTFKSVSSLVECGTSTAEVFRMIYGRRNLPDRKLLALMLERAESRWSDGFLLTWNTRADRESLGARQRGDEELYRLLQTVKGNLVVALIKEEAEGQFSVGLRSTPAIDVGVVARSFGGGGHSQASGFDIKGSLDSVKRAVAEAIAPLLSPR